MNFPTDAVSAWFYCLGQYGTLELGKFIQVNANFILEADRNEPGDVMYGFLLQNLLPVVKRALDQNRMLPGATTQNFLTNTFNGILGPNWRNDFAGLSDYCVQLANTYQNYEESVQLFPLDASNAEPEVNLEDFVQSNLTELQGHGLPMDTGMDEMSMPHSNQSSFASSESGYGSCPSRSSSISISSPEQQYSPQFNEIQSNQPLTKEDALKKRIKLFKVDLSKWKLGEQLKEQKCVDAEFLERNAELLETLVEQAGKILDDALQLLWEKEIQPSFLENFVKTLRVIIQQPPRFYVRTNQLVSKLKVLIPSRLLVSSPKSVSISLRDENNKEAMNKRSSVLKVILKAAKSKRETNGSVLNTVEMKLKMSDNPDKTSKFNSVNDQFFWLHYEIEVWIRGFDKPIKISAISFPIKVVSNISEHEKAMATLLWANAAEHFDVFRLANMQKEIAFEKVCQAIQVEFKKETGREPSMEDFQNVANKFFKNKFDNPQKLMSFEDFQRIFEFIIRNEDDEPEETIYISFLGWWWHRERFIKAHLIISFNKTKINFWSEGIVLGDCSNKTLDSILDGEKEDLFVIRFSGATPCGITIDCFDEKKGEGRVSQRFTLKELGDVGLTRTIDSLCSISQRFTLKELGDVGLKRTIDSICNSKYKTLHCADGVRIEKGHGIMRSVINKRKLGNGSSVLTEICQTPRTAGLMPRYVGHIIRIFSSDWFPKDSSCP